MNKGDREWSREYERKRNLWYRVRKHGSSDGGCRDFPMFGSLEYSPDGAILVSEGGWCGRRWMSSIELRAARERWTRRSYKGSGSEFEKALTTATGVIQCGGCRYFADFDGDCGLCCNPKSGFDGSVTFEHGGCPQHYNIEKGLVEWDGKELKWSAEK